MQLDLVPAPLQPLVDKIANRLGDATPRVVLRHPSGEIALNSGPTSLPVMVGGVTKLVTLSMIWREFDRGAMTPETKIADLLSEDVIHGLCVIDGRDRSDDITIDHLLSHRSGIRDFLAPGGPKTIGLLDQVLRHDRAWGQKEALELARHYPGVFPPGARNKIHYSNTNYLLLGAILEASTGMPFDQLVNLRVVSALGLSESYIFSPQHFDKYYSLAPLNHEGKVLRVPRALASLGATGGLVTSPMDMVKFLSSLWAGELCDEAWIKGSLHQTTRLESGLRFAGGVMTLGGSAKSPRFVGHSGLSGAAALIDTSRNIVGFLATNTITPRQRILQDLSGLMRKLP